MFCLKLFQLAISLLFSNFILFIVQTANSKYESWWKLWMEVYQWIDMIISVIQFPSVTLCFAWKLFQLAIYSHFLFHLIYCTNCKFKIRKLVKAMNGSVSMDWHDNFGHPISKCNTMFCLKVISTCNLLSFPISSYLLYKLQIQSMKVEKAINGSLSIY